MKVWVPVSVLCAAALGGCASNVGTPAPDLTAAAGPPPVLDAITIRGGTRNNFPFPIPEFHFHAPNGDVVYIERELVETNGPFEQTRGAPINLPADLQRRGAVFAGGWPCGPNVYHATMRAYLIARSGQRSNAMTYTIHCNGG